MARSSHWLAALPQPNTAGLIDYETKAKLAANLTFDHNLLLSHAALSRLVSQVICLPSIRIYVRADIARHCGSPNTGD